MPRIAFRRAGRSAGLVPLLAVLIAAPSAGAHVGPPLGFAWDIASTAPALTGQSFRGTLRVTAGEDLRVGDLTVAGEGWSGRVTPPALTLAAGQEATLQVDAVPADASKPLIVEMTVDGKSFRRSWVVGYDAITAAQAPAPAKLLDPQAPHLELASHGPLRSSQTIRVTGHIVYADSLGRMIGADGLSFRIMDDDDPLPDEQMYQGFTDGSGYFDATFSWSDCNPLCDDPDVYLVYETDNGVVNVEHADLLQTDYSWSTENAIIQDFTGSEIDWGDVSPLASYDYRALHIHNSIMRTHELFLAKDGNAPPELDVQWPDTDTYYDPSSQQIHISDAESYVEATHAHEYGHHWMNNFAVLSDPDYCNGICDTPSCSHCVWCSENETVAWQEGFADWVGYAAVDYMKGIYGFDPVSLNDFRYTLETPDTCQMDGLYHNPLQTEGYVGALLRDLDDPEQDDHGLPTDCDVDATILDAGPILATTRLDDPGSALAFLADLEARNPDLDQDLWSTTRNVDPVYETPYPLPAPVIEVQPLPCTVAREGDLVQLSLTSPGSLLQYQWRLNGIALADGPGVTGSNGPVLTMFPVDAGDDGVYDCVVTTCTGTLSTTSAGARLSVIPGATAKALVAWGANTYGQLGLGTTSTQELPTAVTSTLPDLFAVASGLSHTLAVTSTGSVLTWGTNSWGQLGDSTMTWNYVPHATFPVLNGVLGVAAGSFHSLAVDRDGIVWAWGYNLSGNLGDGTTQTRLSPIQVPLSGCAIAVAAGDYFSVALLADGTVWTWGDNGYGELGIGTTGGNSLSPVQVTGLSGCVEIAASTNHVYARRDDSTVWAWGYGGSGELGNGGLSSSATPAQVQGVANAASIASGSTSGYVVRSDGTGLAWGLGTYGANGDSTQATRTSAVAIYGLGGADEIRAGESWAAARLDDGTVRVWGRNYEWELGTTTPSFSLIPTPVPSVGGAVGLGSARYTVFTLGGLGTTGVATAGAERPLRLALAAPAPNPFTGATTLAFDLPADGEVSVGIFDVTGRRVRELMSGSLPAGRHAVTWDGRNAAGERVAAGIYFCRLSAPEGDVTRRIVAVR